MHSKESNVQFSCGIVVLLIIVMISDGDSVFYGHIYPHNIAWTNDMLLEKGFSVKWTNKDKNWLKMRISAPTNGYIAVGFSPHGEMNGSDIVMGWMDKKGDPYLKDMFAIGNNAPSEDQQSNYELLWAEETHENTTFIFRRRWKTCDSQHDYQISDGAVKLIWAYGENDPVLAEDKSFAAEYHKTDFRGVQSVFLKPGSDVQNFPVVSKNVKQWNLTLDNAEIGNRVDLVRINYCKIFKAESSDRQHQIIGFRPVIYEKNKQWVRRITVSECTDPGNDYDGDIFEGYVKYPGEYCAMPLYCTTPLFSWADGSKGVQTFIAEKALKNQIRLMLPKDVGITIDQKFGGATYFLLQIYYEKPEALKIKDSSGVSIFLTDDIQEFEGGTITIYPSKIGPFHFLPPKAQQFKNMALCTTECTEKALPPEGVTLTNVNFHAHSAATKVILRHIRDGKELSPISQDSFYDSSYQQIRPVDPPRKIFPGDAIIIECEYNTMGQENVTFGGVETWNELCRADINYYPRSNLSLCRNHYEFNNFFSSLGIKAVEGHKAILMLQRAFEMYGPLDSAYAIRNTSHGELLYPFDLLNIVESDFYKNITVNEYINRFRWDDNEIITQIAKQLWFGKHRVFCNGYDLQRIPLQESTISYPKYEPYLQPVPSDCLPSGSVKIQLSALMFLMTICRMILIDR